MPCLSTPGQIEPEGQWAEPWEMTGRQAKGGEVGKVEFWLPGTLRAESNECVIVDEPLVRNFIKYGEVKE